MNAAVMPRSGHYHLSPLDPEEFFKLVVENATHLHSHIGYEANIRVIRDNTSPPVHVNILRASEKPPVIQDGDTLLIMRLKRFDRIPKTLQIDDFDYFVADYSE